MPLPSPPADVPLIKQQIRLQRDDEDEYLKCLWDASVAHFNAWSGARLVLEDADVNTLEPDDVRLCPDIRMGLLMAVGHWYEHREAVGDKMIEAPLGTYRLWSPYVNHYLGEPEPAPAAMVP